MGKQRDVVTLNRESEKEHATYKRLHDCLRLQHFRFCWHSSSQFWCWTSMFTFHVSRWPLYTRELNPIHYQVYT